jgi:hypothetical protein
MNNYEETKHKIRKLYNDVELLENKSNILKIGNIKTLSLNDLRKQNYLFYISELIKLPVFKELNITINHYDREFFPDIKVIPIISTTEGYEDILKEKILRPSIIKYFTKEEDNLNLFVKVDISEEHTNPPSKITGGQNFDITVIKRFLQFHDKLTYNVYYAINLGDAIVIRKDTATLGNKLSLLIYSYGTVIGEYILTDDWIDCVYNQYYNLRFVRKENEVNFYIDGEKKM